EALVEPIGVHRAAARRGLRGVGHGARLGAGRASREGRLRSLERAARGGRSAATRAGALGAGLAAIRGIDLGFVELDEGVGGSLVPRIGALLGAFCVCAGTEA